MLESQDLILILVLLLAGAYFWAVLGIRQRALAEAARACRRSDVQLLDQSLYLGGRKIRRYRGWLRICRQYCFEFTVHGEQRYQGRVNCVGFRVEGVELDPFVMPDQEDVLPFL